MVRSNRSLAAAALIALLATSCGTRIDKASFLESVRDGGTTVTDDAETPIGQTPLVAGTTATRGPGGTVSAPDTNGDPGASDGAPVRATGPAIPSNVSRAIAPKEIRVGIHVPVTGAAPLPTDWQVSLDVVEGYINDHPVNGRTVRFIVEDDGYDPARGLAACRKLADSNVLFVIGHTMPTVQDQCAGLFNQRGIPYLMRGVPESTLEGRPISYFGTPSDDLQARLLAEYALKNLGARSKVTAIVTENDQPVSKRVFAERIEAGGGTVGAIENSVPRQPDFGPIIQKLRDAKAQIVFLNIAPVDAIKIAVQSQSAGYHPTWIGEGTHWNYNLALEAAGAALDGAVVFSPWPSVDSAAANEYRQAFATYAPKATPDDIGLIIWGWGMLARHAMVQAGPDLSRYTLVQALNRLRFNEPYWNPVSYSADDHRGPRAVAVFRGDGRAKRWRQIDGFRTGF